MAAGLLRRLGALLYDALLLAALWMLTTVFFLPITGGEALSAARSPLLERVYQATLVAVLVGFYGVSWTSRGQTLGMAAWRLKVERDDGRLLTWPDVLRRLGAALLSWVALGLGWLNVLVDPQRRTWHDRLTHTRVVVVPRS
jgi:uncharacterized RDD family membrane protein YckC